MAEKIGSVLNQYSNQVVVLVGDAVALATWKGSEEPSYEDVVDGNLLS